MENQSEGRNAQHCTVIPGKKKKGGKKVSCDLVTYIQFQIVIWKGSVATVPWLPVTSGLPCVLTDKHSQVMRW